MMSDSDITLSIDRAIVRVRKFDEYRDDDVDDGMLEVDEDFKIDIHYMKSDHHGEAVYETMTTFELRRDGVDPQSMLAERMTVAGWLEELGVDECAWDGAIDATVLGMEELLEEVDTIGRTCLRLGVEIRVIDNHPSMVEPPPEDDVIIEEIVSGDDEVARGLLAASRVRFLSGGDGGCAICLDEFAAEEEVAVLPCSHVWHGECLIPWVVRGNTTCPLCRFDFDLHQV